MRSLRWVTSGAVTTAAVLVISTSGVQTPGLTAVAADAGSLGTYAAIAPVRVLDTRNGTGGQQGPVTAGGVVSIQIDGKGYQTSGHVSAVVLNVTVTAATSAGFLTVYPGGGARPAASNLNFVAGTTRANSVTVQVGDDGKVDIYNSSNSAQIIADLSGYFVGDETIPRQGELQPVQTERILDTRAPGFGVLPGGSFVNIPVSYGSAADAHVKALAVNVTAVGATSAGYLTAWDGESSLPATSTLNYTTNSVTPNFAIVPTSICPPAECGEGTAYPMIGIYNGSWGSFHTHVIVDIVGFFDDGALGNGLRFHPISPNRIVDTRTGHGGTPLGAGGIGKVSASAVTNELTGALALNVTAVDPSAATYLTLWPSDDTQPTTSTLNTAAHQTVANAAITLISPDHQFNVFNRYGTTNYLIDVAGTYDYGSSGAATATPRTLQPTPFS
ncbi:MAG: hypothetical protein HOV79_00845 [Hamadaea sp.]|nr:hypothetical protein [Hamadaea sp.]